MAFDFNRPDTMLTTEPHKQTRRNSGLAEHTSFLIEAVAMIGFVVATKLHFSGLDRTDGPSGNVFYYLFARNEPLALGILLIASLFCRFLFRSQFHHPMAYRLLLNLQKHNLKVIISTGVFAICWLGTFVVYHNFPLCLDEYLAEFQAKIFLAGSILAKVEMPWQNFADAMATNFVTYNPVEQTWISIYLPIYSAIRAAFAFVGLPSITNPLLAAISVWTLAGVVENLWPTAKKSNVVVALVVLASSTQFLITSMSFYAFPAHLAFNLMWLWLYTKGNRISLALTPWVGVLSVGLHEPHYHVLFVLPFLLRLLRERRWHLFIYFGSVYLAGSIGWLMWLNLCRPGVASGAGGAHSLANTFGILGIATLVIQMMYLALLASWQSFGMIFLAIFALRKWEDLAASLRDLAWGCVLAFGFHALLHGTQSHGWGFRFFHPVLGNLAILSVVGWNRLKAYCGTPRAAMVLLLSTCIAAVQLPIRCVQVEHFVRPFAEGMRYLSSIKEPFVVLDHEAAWYSYDLLRNEPFLNNSPKIFLAMNLGPKNLGKLRSMGEVHIVQPEELARLGLHPRRYP